MDKLLEADGSGRGCFELGLGLTDSIGQTGPPHLEDRGVCWVKGGDAECWSSQDRFLRGPSGHCPGITRQRNHPALPLGTLGYCPVS